MTSTSLHRFVRGPFVPAPPGRPRCVLSAMVTFFSLFPSVNSAQLGELNAVQVSFNIAMVEPVTSVGGMVNSAPRALIRS